VPRKQYHKLLAEALTGEADFAVLPLDRPIPGAQALELATTSSGEMRVVK
jgi:leucyl/phenylalanyl-tRNA--protein transferase